MRLKNVVLVLLGTLVLESMLVVAVVVWLGRAAVSVSPPIATIGSTMNATESEAILKERLDNYSKRAEDVQKLISLLLALTTIYAIALAVSAYTSVQNNLQQADRAIENLDAIVRNNLRQSEKAIERLDKLVTEQEEIIKSNREVLPKQLEEMQETTKYSTRIAIASVISQFPLQRDDYQEVQKSVISSLLELRNGQYATDRIVNQQLARLYGALNRYQNAEEVMSSFIERKEQLGQRDDAAIVDAYYDRACYQSLRWSSAKEDVKIRLTEGIKRDLSRAFGLDDTLRDYAKRDPEFENIASEAWFGDLAS